MSFQPPFPRTERVAELIQQELALLINQKAQDPRFRTITITHVNVSPDLKNAKIYVRMLSDEVNKAVLLALNKAQSFFRRELARSINLRITPTLMFIYDERLNRAERLVHLINMANDD